MKCFLSGNGETETERARNRKISRTIPSYGKSLIAQALNEEKHK